MTSLSQQQGDIKALQKKTQNEDAIKSAQVKPQNEWKYDISVTYLSLT